MAERKKAGAAKSKQDSTAEPKQTGDSAADAPAPSVRKGYEAAREPERQGDGDPGPDPVSESP